jgi:hypothetical protein
MTDHQDNAAGGLYLPDIPTGADTLTAALDLLRMAICPNASH